VEQDHAIASAGGLVPTESDLGPGALVEGRYRLASVAARSPNDVTFNALDERSRVRVRVRVTSVAPDPELCRLSHPAAPKVLDTGRTGRWHYAVHEWFDGDPVELPTTGVAGDPARLRAWASLAMDLLDLLEHVHQSAGRAHGDLGLHSLWEGRDGRLRLVDLSAPDGPLTPEAVPYASPERLRGMPREPTSDLYSLAAILYALAYGTPPFGTDPTHARSGHLLRLAADAPPGETPLSAPFLSALRLALDKHPTHRFGSASRMREAFDEAIRDMDDPANRTTDYKIARVRVPPDDVQTETIKVRRKTPEPPPARPATLEEADPDFGTMDSAPERLEAPADGGMSTANSDVAGLGGAIAVLAATAMAVGAVALAATTVLGGVAFFATRRAYVDPPVLPPIEQPATPPAPAPAEVAPPTPEVPPTPPTERVPVRFSASGWSARPADGFDGFVETAEQWPGRILLTGHTDSRGSAATNEKVGRVRAEAVRRLLQSHGIPKSRVDVDSKGETAPIADNDTPEGRAANRRVEATFTEPR
jgi:hypothetical protein